MSMLGYAERMACRVCGLMVVWALASVAAALPADPNNAALLYYQAMLTQPKLDEAGRTEIHEFVRNGRPGEQIRRYLDLPDSRTALELLQVATRIRECDWGVIHSLGRDLDSEVILGLRDIGLLLELDARALVVDGRYGKALDRCLEIIRCAGHLGDTTPLLFGISQATNQRALACIQHVLGSTAPNGDILAWLGHELRSV